MGMPSLRGSLHNGGAVLYGHSLAVDRDVYHFSITSSLEAAVAKVIAAQAAAGLLRHLLIRHGAFHAQEIVLALAGVPLLGVDPAAGTNIGTAGRGDLHICLGSHG